MKTLNVLKACAVIAFTAVLIYACDFPNSSSNNLTGNFTMYVFDYSENHYFLDTLYRRSFTEYHKGITSGFLDSNRILTNNNQFEVWVQCDIITPNNRFCVGKVMLGARPPQGYDTSITKPENIPGEKFAGYFVKLESYDYYLNDTAGFVGLNSTISDYYCVGVVYRNVSNQYFGKGEYESGASDTLILKLVKVVNQSPDLTPTAWKLLMKNVYKMPFTNLQSSTTIKTMFNKNNVWCDTITGYSIPLITMVKLDRFNNTTFLPPPDGKFDWLTGKTIFPETGYLIFPTLEPFGRDLPLSPNDSAYCFYEMYSKRKSIAIISVKALLYHIKGNAVYY
jgi:hypothetical protein